MNPSSLRYMKLLNPSNLGRLRVKSQINPSKYLDLFKGLLLPTNAYR